MNDKGGLYVPKQRSKASLGSRLSRHISLRGRTTTKVAVEPGSRSASSQGLFVPRSTSDPSSCPKAHVQCPVQLTNVEKYSDGATSAFSGERPLLQSTKIKDMARPTEQNASHSVSYARNRRLGSPEVDMRPALRVLTESTCVPADTKKVLWVAVEVYGELKDPLGSMSRDNPLDIVVILDNSPAVSSQSIHQACDAIFVIAQLLSRTSGDRLAIICTNVRHPASDFTMACMFHSLKTPDLSALKELPGFALQDRSFRGEQDTNINETLNTAFRVLESRQQAKEHNTPPRELSARIIVISPTHSIWREAARSGDFPVIVHAIDPVIKPQRALPNAFDTPTIKPNPINHDLLSSHDQQANGWVLMKSRLIDSNHFFSSKVSKNGDCGNNSAYEPRSTFDDGLRALINHSRARSNISELRNLRIKVMPMDGSVIKKILGSSSYEQLCPGQRVQIMIELEIPRLKANFPDQMPLKMPSKPSLDTIDSLLYELEHKIGGLHSDLFTVSVTCDDLNSLLKTPRTVTIEETCSVRRTDSSSLWSTVVSCRHQQTESTKLYNEVYSRLMYQIASCSSPETALMRLRHIYPNVCHNSTLVASNAKVEEELRYQRSKISSAIAHQDSGVTQSQAWNLHSDSSIAPVPSYVQPLMLGARPSPESDTTMIHYETDRIDSGIETGTPQSPKFAMFDSPRDAARTVWRRMRETTHTTDLPSVWPTERSSYEEGRVDAIRATALRNKRSVGAATLRSLSEGIKENIFPFE